MKSNTQVNVFTSRKIDESTAREMGALFRDGRFIFLYRRNGKNSFAKIRTQDKEFWIEPKGAALHLWGIDALTGLSDRPVDPLVITEGEFDAIAVKQCCGGYVVSVPNGSSGKRTNGNISISEDRKFSYLWNNNQRIIEEVDQFDKIILAVDGDEPGQILRDELSLRIGDSRCWYVTYPPHCKDVNDVLIRHGEEAVRNLIKNARPIRPGCLTRPSDIPPRPREIAYSTGWAFMDANLTLVRPELIVVTGIPGHGKGQFIRSMTFHLAEAHGWKTAYLTPEDPAHRVKRDMRRFALRKNKYSSREEQELAMRWIDDHFLISQPPEDEPITLDFVEHEMEVAALQHGCEVFVIDPWNEIEHFMERNTTIDIYIEQSIRRLKRKMRRLGLVLIISAHPTKLGDGQTPTLYSINGSANWKNKADHGIIIHRENMHDNVAKIVVEKSKDWETTGSPGELYTKFDRDECDYHLFKHRENTDE